MAFGQNKIAMVIFAIVTSTITNMTLSSRKVNEDKTRGEDAPRVRILADFTRGRTASWAKGTGHARRIQHATIQLHPGSSQQDSSCPIWVAWQNRTMMNDFSSLYLWVRFPYLQRTLSAYTHCFCAPLKSQSNNLWNLNDNRWSKKSGHGKCAR